MYTIASLLDLPLRIQLLCVAAIFLLSGISAYAVLNERAIRARGSHARKIRTWAPLGLDYIFKVMHNARNYRNLLTWETVFPSINEDECRLTAEASVLGTRYIMTADSENIKAVLATQFLDFGKGEPFHEKWKGFIGDSIFTTDGHMWRESRQMIRPLFTRERVGDLEVLERHVGGLQRAIERENRAPSYSAKVEKEVDMALLINRLTLDVATDFMLGNSVQSLENPYTEFEEAFARVQHIQSIIARSGPFDKFIPRGAFNAGMHTLHNFLLPFIELALTSSPSELASKPEASYTFLHELASSTRDPCVLRDQLMSILLAGRDTTAAALTWSVFELARNPRVVEKLRAEIIGRLGATQAPNYRDLKDMKYLQTWGSEQATISEVLRLYPSVPYNIRTALRDTSLPRGGGPNGDQPVGILKDTLIVYSPLFSHRHHSIYPPHAPDPEMFCPERWEKWVPRPWTYIPFNGGPRICLGQQFALTEIGYTLVRLLQRFEGIRLRDGSESMCAPLEGGRRSEAERKNRRPLMKADIGLKPVRPLMVVFTEAATTREK